MSDSKNNKPDDDQPRKRRRRSKWARDLEHLVPGGKELSDVELELRILDFWRHPNRNRKGK
ncbi:hypothetical protein [Fodinicola acaciae]|uniref:hypothetical protein n=1 Tax=Fodinicola acaciae TaxID=2681555 RepID=UPI0013D49E92|nr:hypothetical protein [Fodinicola acaciae]